MTVKQNHNFILVLDKVTDQTKRLEDDLYENGCDDALICFRNSTVYLDFDRLNSSLENAIISAINDVECSESGARVIRVAPDNYVSESEIANRFDVKRQTVSQWIKGQRYQSTPFPHPCLGLESKSTFWYWPNVLEWFLNNEIYKNYKQLDLSYLQSLLNNSYVIENINNTLLDRESDYKTIDIRKKYRAKLKAA